MILNLWFCFLTSLSFTYLTIKFAWKTNFLSHPNSIFVTQQKPVAYLGGIAILLSILFNITISNYTSLNDQPNQINMLIVISIFTIIGTIDDYYELTPIIKLLLQIIGAILTTYLGYSIEFTGLMIINHSISIFLLVLSVNAFNLLDVSDGLLSAIFISMIAFFYLATGHQMNLMIFGISVFGFLLFNKPNAKIYLGDSGSHLLGCLAYIVSVNYLDFSFSLSKSITLFLVFSVVIFEFLFLIYRRTKQNLSIFKGSPDHYSILLRKSSWTKNQVLYSSIIISSIFSLVAYFSSNYTLRIKTILLLLTIIIYYVIGRHINHYSNDTK